MPKLSTIRDVGVYQARQLFNRSSGPMHRIFASGGGHGSVFLKDALRLTLCKIHVRPDVVFPAEQSLDECPDDVSVTEFKEKTGFAMDKSRTVNDNIVSYLNYVEDIGAIVLLSRMSRMGKFFTTNGLNNAICLVRHPLHAYVSFIGHRHPKASDHLGGLESDDRICWYADQWNKMTSDYLDSGSKILRFEFMLEDLKGVSNPDLPYLLRNWKMEKRNSNVLSPKKTQLLNSLVEDTYFRVYDSWNI